jgi:hypothetical protein
MTTYATPSPNGRLSAEQQTAAAFLGKHWPEEGQRNNAAGALAGGLLRADWSEDMTEAFLGAVAEAAGDDEIEKRLPRVAETAEKLRKNEKVTGWPSLADYLGNDGKNVVRRVRVLLGLTIDLERLASLKGLPLQFLQSLGLHDLPDGGVGIPYRDGSGRTVAVKKRIRAVAKDGSFWPEGQALTVYGEERLEEGREAAYRILVEGESDCWTLWHHQFPALGIPGSNTVNKTLQLGHVGKRKLIYVIQEPDGAGTEFAKRVMNRLAEIGWSGELRVVRLEGVKDPSELHTQDPAAFPQRFREALELAKPLEINASCESRALPSNAPPPWPSQPGNEAFYGLAGKIVRTIEPASEADPVALLIQTLVSYGNVVGRNAHFRVEGDRHYSNEFAVLVGRSSKARKGTSFGRIHFLFREAEEQWAKEHVQSGLSSGEGLIWAVRDPIRRRECVKVRNQQPRYDEIEADPGIADKRLLVYEPEFANVLKQTERQGNTLSPLLRQAWDCGNLRTLTKNSPARATGAHISLIGHITAEELRRYLTQTETANGFGNRHLWLCADRSKLLPEGGHLDLNAWLQLRDDLAIAIAFARTVGEVHRDEEARVLWREIYGALSGGRPGLAGSLLGRAEAHVMRLALIYALMNHSSVIQASHLLAATTLWDYVERSVVFLFGDSLGDPVADELLRLLRASPGGLTRNDMRDFFKRHQSSERIGQALGLLLQHHLARFEQQDTSGRPAERWFATSGGTER